MISKKTILAWVFSAIVSVAMLAIPGRALAHDHDGDGDGWGHKQWHHDNGQHRGWYKHQGGDRDEDEEEEHEHRGYYQQPYGYGYGHQEPDGDEGYGWNQPRYGYNGNGMVNRRHPNLYWACDSQGHHCHWARRYGSGYRYPQTGLNPFAFGGANNGNGYYGNNNSNYGNGNYGNSSLGGLGSLLGPLFGGQQP